MASVVSMRLSASGGLRNRISTVPAGRRIPSSRPCVSRRAVPEGIKAPVEPAISGTGGDGSGGSSGGGFGGDGDGNGGFGNNYYALAAAVPCYDLSASVSLPPWCTVENCLLLIACLILPVLGVYLKRNSLDKYVLLSLVLTFLPPLGIVFALAHCFLDWNPL